MTGAAPQARPALGHGAAGSFRRRRAPRVVYIGHSAALSGAEIALVRMLERLRDIKPLVVLAEDGPLTTRLTALGVPTRIVPLPAAAVRVERAMVTPGRLPITALAASSRYAVRLAGTLRTLAPDIVHTNSMKAHLYGGVAAAIAGIPHVWHARDRAASDYLPLPAVGLVRLAAKTLPAAMIANSHCTLASYPGVRNAHVVYDGVPAHVSRRTAPRTAEPLRIGIVGRLAPWKGQHAFLRSFAAAFPDGAHRGVIIGDSLFGEERYATELRGLAQRLDVGDRIEFTGFTADVPGQLDQLDVLVHCSTIPEPFGQVVVEGMAAGLAVIASAAGGPAEIVEDEVTGLLVAPNDVGALAAAMRRLADDADLRRTLGTAARRASERWRPERCAAGVAAVYARVLDAPHRRQRIRAGIRGLVGAAERPRRRDRARQLTL